MKPRILLANLLAVMVVACGGGGGSTAGINGGGTPQPVGGINGGGIAVGPITGFGSVFVNGIEFSTSGSTITIEGASANEAQLKVGQVVEVRGNLNTGTSTGTATTIAANNEYLGPVQNIDLAASTFTLLGNVVRVTGSTVFDNSFTNPSLAGLAGLWVEVNGLRNSAGEVVATRIEPKAANSTIELNGTITALDTTAKTFKLGNATVNYTSATVSGTLANNSCAEAKGTVVNGNTLTATRVEVKSCTVAANNNDIGEIEGFVTRFASATDFDVGTQKVTTTGTTTYQNGTAADLALNRRIEAEGQFNASGVLVATKIEFKSDSTTRITGLIDALDSTNKRLTIFGISISTSSGTSYEDNSSANARPFGFAQLRTGDYVELRGSEGSTALTAAATLIVRRNPDTRRELRSAARNVASPNFTLVGVQVVTSASTSFKDLGGNTVTQAQFFAQLAGKAAKVRGSFAGSTFTATEAELENLN